MAMENTMERRISDIETKCDTLKRLHDAAADERNTARGAVRELERQVFALQQQRDVLQTCLDRHQRDEADPPGYLQDAVIRAAGLGALHTERDALRARLDAAPVPAKVAPDLEGISDRLVAISSAIADCDDRTAQEILRETLKMLAAAPEAAR